MNSISTNCCDDPQECLALGSGKSFKRVFYADEQFIIIATIPQFVEDYRLVYMSTVKSMCSVLPISTRDTLE